MGVKSEILPWRRFSKNLDREDIMDEPMDEMQRYIDNHRSISEPVPIPLETLERWLLKLRIRHDGYKPPGNPGDAIRDQREFTEDAAAAVAVDAK
jgi:hypothetical protein